MKTQRANTATMSEADVYITLRKFPQIDEETAKSMARTITLKPEVATKTDIAELRVGMAQLENKMTTQMAQMESRMLRWFVSITILGWGVMMAAISLIR